MKMLCLSPSVPPIDPELLVKITKALNADGSRLLLLPIPQTQRAQIYRYGLQPHTSSPIEKNLLWQNLLSTQPLDPRLPSSNADLVSQSDRVTSVDRVCEHPILAPLLTAFQAVGIQSLSIVPLRYHDRCLGCLTLFRSTPALLPDLDWTDDELQLAQSLAIHIYLAVMQQRVEQMFKDRAYYDILTGLPNRLLLNHCLTLALAKMPVVGEFLAIVLLNLDRFKNINDSLGHRAGDRLLQLIAERLKYTLGDDAIIGRWSGDEFGLVVPSLSDLSAANEFANRVLKCFDLPFGFDRSFPVLKTNSLYIKARMGIAIATSANSDLETLLHYADAALDRAQKNGRNNYEIYIDTDIIVHPTTDRLRLANMLDGVSAALANRSLAVGDRQQFDNRQLLLHYQPQIDIQTGKIIGIEALLRCRDLHAKIISPADLIPIAEETGSIIQIGEWVIRTACQQNKLWQDLGLGNFPIAVNFSVKQLQERNLIDTITGILAETGLEATALEVEITESIAIKDLDLTISILESLREIGVRISLDDFGTGYSSLAALKYLPLDRLKIDRTFIQELRANTIDAGIVRTIVNLGHELNLNVVAEGVETIEQFEFLRSINCDAVQGFLFSRPLTATDLETAIATGSYWHQVLSRSPNSILG
jgi:diguanylate cyclase (GGDEF)-like protein